MSWKGNDVRVSLPCAGQYVGLEEIYDGIWDVYLGPVKLGIFVEEQLQIIDHTEAMRIQKV